MKKDLPIRRPSKTAPSITGDAKRRPCRLWGGARPVQVFVRRPQSRAIIPLSIKKAILLNRIDVFVKSPFSPPLAGGNEGEGEGREFLTFYEAVKFRLSPGLICG
jgi:hypothetical protein